MVAATRTAAEGIGDLQAFAVAIVGSFELLGGADNVVISPSGDVWVQNPDGSWTDEGPAGKFTGSGGPSGRTGPDRGGGL